MHRISRAPVLSATRSRDSCWITTHSFGVSKVLSRSPRERLISCSAEPRSAWRPRRFTGRSPRERLIFCSVEPSSAFGLAVPRLLRSLEDLDDAPALGCRQRTRLHQQDAIADAARVVLVV